ncbi:hypothetical protein KL905_002282 [Ogataea polymorpha]|nr:hypothetical protein KL908_002644 [Ogataea polymorpha]KAG7905566.1 hypothetical protein KL907_002713 [Ogataea polymorpha]KAG7909467.1 hypothetical protein KL906_002223 [Ogataea polymorpha]KAG7922260.1 hypothetical protein KL905_002282 [Ogataea polymorpha]KAG7936454.1 hypothetical protein KL934_001921 [Ogataea polymorpha]
MTLRTICNSNYTSSHFFVIYLENITIEPLMNKVQNFQHLARHYEGISRIVSDWDDTITAKDTIAVIFDVLGKNPEFGYDYFFKLYMDSFNRFQNEVLPGKSYSLRDCLEREIMYQKAIKDSEKSSINEAVRLAVFRGIGKSTFENLVNKIPIRAGFENFYNHLCNTNMHFSVLSINWTGLMIAKYFASFKKQPDQILVNEFEFDSNGICTGNVVTDIDIRTGYDKLVLTKELVGNDRAMYVGDSSTDVLSMIYCDKAIIIKGGSASKALCRLGYKVYNINDEISEREAKFVKYLEIDDWNDLLQILKN